MRAFFYIFFIIFTFSNCQPNSANLTYEMAISHYRLLKIAANNTEDTLLLRRVWDSAYSIAITVSNRQHDSLFAVVSRLLGNQLFAINEMEACTIYKKGLIIGLRQLEPTEDIIIRLYRSIGLSFYNINDYKTALIYFDSVKITDKNFDLQKMKIQNLMNIAECYQRLNDKQSAGRIFNETEPIAQKQYQKTDLAAFYNQYSSCLRKLKKYQEAIEKTEKALNIMRQVQIEQPLIKNDSNLVASIYYYKEYALNDSGCYKLAELSYLAAMSIYKKQKNWTSYKRGLSNMGIMYRFDKQFDKAEKNLTEGINLFNKSVLSDDDIRLKASFYVNRSEVYLETKQYKKAINDQDSAIYFFILYEKRPSLMAVMMQARPVLISVLGDKAKVSIALAENGQDRGGYQKALKLTQEIIRISDDIRADYFSDDAKLTLANDIKPALERGIYICKKLYERTKDNQYLEQAFDFVEYSRSMVLYENARLDNQLPPNLKAENAELKKREAALIAKNNVEELQEYLRLKRQFREKIKSLNRNQLAKISELQTTLIKDDKTALIEFFVGDSSIFAFVLIKNDFKLIELNKSKNFEKQINNLRKSITQATPMHNSEGFETQSKALYNYLLNPIITQLNSQINQLIIAPDGLLNYLPFDILIKDANSLVESKINSGKSSKDSSFIPELSGQAIHHSSFKNTAFLVKDYTISYAYSANLLLEQKRTKRETAAELFAGFAAKYENKDTTYAIADVSRAVLTRDGAYELKGAKEEVNQISNLIGGKAFVNESATEGVFKREANHYKILHFAMHSLTDDKDPALSRLLFTLTPKDTTNDNDLTAAELYTTSLKADLAVLSACNTGFGTLNKGEGVMSLARAFTYAGVPSTVTSLWKVPDTETREIMVDFYKNLKNGLSKDAALRAAKLTYLNNAPESVAANPYFWAGFVPMGNMEAMDFSEKRPLSPEGIRDVAARHIWGVLAGVLGVYGVGLWLKWRKNPSI